MQNYFLYLWSFRRLEEAIVLEWIIVIKINLILLFHSVSLFFESHCTVQEKVVAGVRWCTEITL
jgi:hypothetical protein